MALYEAEITDIEKQKEKLNRKCIHVVCNTYLSNQHLHDHVSPLQIITSMTKAIHEVMKY